MARKKSSALDGVVGTMYVLFHVFKLASLLIGLALVILYIAFANVFSLSTIIDYGPSLWMNNIVSIHLDKSYQADRSIPVYSKTSASEIGKASVFTIPEGAIFQYKGDIKGENLSWSAVSLYSGAHRVTGFIAYDTPKVDAVQILGNSAIPGAHFVTARSDETNVRKTAFVRFQLSPSDANLSDAIRRDFLNPAMQQELTSQLDIKYAAGSVEISSIKENNEFALVEEFNTPSRIAYIPKSQRSTYQEIKKKYGKTAVNAVLYQADANFDLLAAIQAGQIKTESNRDFYFFLTVAAGIVGLYLRFLYQRAKITCGACGAKSHNHEKLERVETQRYKHATQRGQPDKRYKKNPVITTTTTLLRCETCGKNFKMVSER